MNTGSNLVFVCVLHQVEINRMVGDLEREHSELQMAQRLTQERQIEKRDASVLAIQSWYRAERYVY